MRSLRIESSIIIMYDIGNAGKTSFSYFIKVGVQPEEPLRAF